MTRNKPLLKCPVRLSQSTYNEAIKPKNSRDKIIIMDKIAEGITGSELNQNLHSLYLRSVAFPGTTTCKLLYYIDVHLENRVKCFAISTLE